jgi:hypothetical protein
VLSRAVELNPDYVPARAGRGVLLARAGKRDAALQDAKEALRRDTRAPNLYQVGCIYALTAKTHPEDRREALKLLWDGLRTGFALDLVDTDTDLDALRADAAFQALVRDAKALHAPRACKRLSAADEFVKNATIGGGSEPALPSSQYADLLCAGASPTLTPAVS